MTLINCFYCKEYVSDTAINYFRSIDESLGKDPDESWPLDVNWKNCTNGPDVWLNCYRRTHELRYYKGKYPVAVLTKGKRSGKHGPITWRVSVLEKMPRFDEGEAFTTIPRLLWTHQVNQATLAGEQTK